MRLGSRYLSRSLIFTLVARRGGGVLAPFSCSDGAESLWWETSRLLLPLHGYQTGSDLDLGGDGGRVRI